MNTQRLPTSKRVVKEFYYDCAIGNINRNNSIGKKLIVYTSCFDYSFCFFVVVGTETIRKETE